MDFDNFIAEAVLRNATYVDGANIQYGESNPKTA
jgi:hypothetical protein